MCCLQRGRSRDNSPWAKFDKITAGKKNRWKWNVVDCFMGTSFWLLDTVHMSWYETGVILKSIYVEFLCVIWLWLLGFIALFDCLLVAWSYWHHSMPLWLVWLFCLCHDDVIISSKSWIAFTCECGTGSMSVRTDDFKPAYCEIWVWFDFFFKYFLVREWEWCAANGTGWIQTWPPSCCQSLTSF